MIFLRYENFREYIRLYPVISFILAINIAVMLLDFVFGKRIVLYGAVSNFPGLINDWWRYITSIFIHGGFGHLLFNCFSLYLFGPYLERLLGRIKFVGLYLASGIVGNMFTVLLMKKLTFSVGASGAIYGLFGAYLFMVLYRKRYIDAQSSKVVLIILAIGVVYSLIVPQINILAHLGGFIAGFLIYPLLHLKK